MAESSVTRERQQRPDRGTTDMNLCTREKHKIPTGNQELLLPHSPQTTLKHLLALEPYIIRHSFPMNTQDTIHKRRLPWTTSSDLLKPWHA